MQQNEMESIAPTSLHSRSTGRKWCARVIVFLEESRSPSRPSTNNRRDNICSTRTRLFPVRTRRLCMSSVWRRLFSEFLASSWYFVNDKQRERSARIDSDRFRSRCTMIFSYKHESSCASSSRSVFLHAIYLSMERNTLFDIFLYFVNILSSTIDNRIRRLI